MGEEVCNLPTVCAIIERTRDGVKEVLIQTRWKPDADPRYSGRIEIPAGLIEPYEDVYAALRREVKEETGLEVVNVLADQRGRLFSDGKDEAFTFKPFCCFQQLKDGKPWLGFAFICQVDDAVPVPQADEVRDIRWVSIDELDRLTTDEPDRFFTLVRGVMRAYLERVKSH
ncbi:MAG: NUDIX hydrolase [Nanoarchaeota archaeon]